MTLTLTFQSKNHITSMIFKGHSLHQVLTLWDHSFLSYAAGNRQRDRQTDKQTDGAEHPTMSTYSVVGGGNYLSVY